MDMARADSFRTSTPRTSGSEAALRLLTLTEVEQPGFLTAWNRLVAHASEPNPFFEPWFLLPSLRQWGARDRAVVKAWFVDDRLAGLLPITRSADYYSHRIPHVAGWLHTNAFCCAPLILAGHEDAFWRALLAHFDRWPRRALFLHLPKLHADGPVFAALDRVLAAHPARPLNRRAGKPCAVIG